MKLAKEAKFKIKDAAKKAFERSVANPEKKWDEYIDELVKAAEDLGKVAGKANATFQEAKDFVRESVERPAPIATKTSGSTKPSFEFVSGPLSVVSCKEGFESKRGLWFDRRPGLERTTDQWRRTSEN